MRREKRPADVEPAERAFVWKKKQRSEERRGVTESERRARDRRRREEAAAELERVQRRRAERERDAAERELKMQAERREADRRQAGDWAAREDDFQLAQAQRRAAIRVREGRARLVDHVAVNLILARSPESELARELERDGVEMDTAPPTELLVGRNLAQLEELCADAARFAALENNGDNREFWRALQLVAEDAAEVLRPGDSVYASVQPDVLEEIEALLDAKTPPELERLAATVAAKLDGSTALSASERAYWRALGRLAAVWQTRARLRRLHDGLVAVRLGRRQSAAFTAAPAVPVEREVDRIHRVLLIELGVLERLVAAGPDEDAGPGVSLEDYVAQQRRGAAPAGVREMSEAAELATLTAQRHGIVRQGTVRVITDADMRAGMTNDERLERAFRVEDAAALAAQSASAEDELVLDAEMDEDATENEVPLAACEYAWAAEHRPRKPRYFNRVRTAFEWNQYNRTHYDQDNPPPKIVQGYRFNIFYPDLVDRACAPTFSIERDAGFPETVILRFTAGAPYEDVAFRILNREWERSRRHGFRCVFDHGTLQLHFRFKRYLYRR